MTDPRINRWAKGMALGGLLAVCSTSVEACMTTAELQADQLRFLELQLKVAALRCRFENPKFASLYNRFVRAHKGAIKASRWPVEAYLKRHTQMDMDSYVTKTANRISLASLDVSGFCDNAAAVARLAGSSADPVSALDLLPVAYRAPRSVCPDGAGHNSVTATATLPPAEAVRR